VMLPTDVQVIWAWTETAPAKIKEAARHAFRANFWVGWNIDVEFMSGL